MELLLASWVAPTEQLALQLGHELNHWLYAAKLRSPMYPGWHVGWTTIHHPGTCTVTVVFHVEPEADLPQV